MIPYGRQNISAADIRNVVKVLKSDFLTQGPQVTKFEKEFSNYVGSTYSVASNSATSSLHLACLALGLSSKDVVWTSPISFVATSNAAIYCGAKVKFIDIDANTFNLCPKNLKKELEKAAKTNSLPKIVIPVHLCGQSADMKKIYALSKKYKFKIIEDASHAVGGSHYGSKIGSCQYSDIAVFSFHPVKIITSGEGGMSCTNKRVLADKMRLLMSHGITRDPKKLLTKEVGGWYYEQLELGFNYRLTDIQAALGSSQLKRVDTFVKKRNILAKRYIKLLSSLPLDLPAVNDYNYSSFHLFVIRIPQNLKNKRREIFEDLKKSGIGVNVHYIPIYKHPFYQNAFNKVSEKNFPNAENYYSRAISIPLYPDLSFSDQQKVVAAITSSIANYL